MRWLALAVVVFAACAREDEVAVVAPPGPAPGGDTVAAAPAPGSLALASAPGGATDPYQVGLATWYGPGFAGKKTSNGERFDPRAATAAHRRLPFGTWVEVRRPDAGRAVLVRINDRGPWGDDRKVIDLSRAAAEQLGIVGMGVAPVEIRIVRGP